MVEHKHRTPAEGGHERHHITETHTTHEQTHVTKMHDEVHAERTGEKPALNGDGTKRMERAAAEHPVTAGKETQDGKGEKHMDVPPIQHLLQGEKLKLDN